MPFYGFWEYQLDFEAQNGNRAAAPLQFNFPSAIL
jgi:hypothetical protein